MKEQKKTGIPSALRWEVAALGSFFLVILVRLFLLWGGSPEYTVSLVPDDAFYYLKIALNVSDGKGSTFDGIHATNGYHPLWLIVCSSVALLTQPLPSDSTSLLDYLRVIVSLEMFLGIVAFGLVYFASRRFGSKPLARILLAVGFGFPFLFYGMSDGLESGLVLLGLSSILYTCSRVGAWNAFAEKDFLTLGLLFSLLIMARLDTVFFLVAFCISCLYFPRFDSQHQNKSHGEVFRSIACLLAPTGLMLSVYLYINYSTFGVLLPVSGSLKSHFSFSNITVSRFSGHSGGFLVQLVSVSGALYYLTRKRGLTSIEQAYVSLGIYLLLCFLYYTLFVRWGIHRWYFVPAWFTFFFGAALFFEKSSRGAHSNVPSKLMGFALVATVLVSLLIHGVYYTGRSKRAFQSKSYTAAQWVNETYDQPQRFAMSDSGSFGYFSNHSVINLDGLVNEPSYLSTLEDSGLMNYLQETNIDYFVYHGVEASKVEPGYGSFTYRLPLHLRENLEDYKSSLRLNERDEVYRVVYNDGTGDKVFLIWELSFRF